MAPQKKRVIVVGAGASGMSCADALAKHPDKFEVTLIGELSSPPDDKATAADLDADAVGYCGGQAFSIPIDKEKYGAPFLNQGVQGGSYIYQYVSPL